MQWPHHLQQRIHDKATLRKTRFHRSHPSFWHWHIVRTKLTCLYTTRPAEHEARVSTCPTIVQHVVCTQYTYAASNRNSARRMDCGWPPTRPLRVPSFPAAGLSFAGCGAQAQKFPYKQESSKTRAWVHCEASVTRTLFFLAFYIIYPNEVRSRDWQSRVCGVCCSGGRWSSGAPASSEAAARTTLYL